MKTNHEQFVQKLESNYNEKLINEYDKYLRLEEKMAKMRMDYERQLEELRNAKKLSEETITNDFLHKLREKEVQWEEVSDYFTYALIWREYWNLTCYLYMQQGIRSCSEHFCVKKLNIFKSQSTKLDLKKTLKM